MLTINNSDLNKALSIVSKVVPGNPIIPMLGGILFEVNPKSITLSATNFEVSIRYKFGITKGEKLQTVVPSDTISKLSSIIYEDKVKVAYSEAEQEMTLKTKSSTNKVKCIAAKDFPSLPKSPTEYITIPVKQLKQMVNRVSFAAKREGEQAISGVEITVDKNVMTMFALDGFHLSFETFTIDNKKKAKMNSIVKAQTLEMVAKLLDDEGDVKIYASDNQMFFSGGDIYIVCQLLDGNFPSHDMVKAPKPKVKTVTATLDLLRACKQAEVFAKDSGKAALKTSGMLMSISIDEKQRGGTVVNIPSVIKGDELLIGVNIFFLKQFLEICNTGNVLIDFVNNESPIVLRMEGNKEYHHIIMPMAL